MFDGFFVNGPLLHYAYEALERCMPAEESLISAMMQVNENVICSDTQYCLCEVGYPRVAGNKATAISFTLD